MEDIRKICNLIVDLSKFTHNKKILSKFIDHIVNNIRLTQNLAYVLKV